MAILKDYFSDRLFKDPKFQIFHDVTAEDRVSIIECGIYAFSKGKEFTIENSNKEIKRALNESHTLEKKKLYDEIEELRTTLDMRKQRENEIAKDEASKILDQWKENFLHTTYQEKLGLTVNFEKSQEKINYLEEQLAQYKSQLIMEREIKDTYMMQLFNKKNSYNKGHDGEQEVHGYLSQLYPNKEIYNCSKEDNRGDYYLDLDDEFRVMIESKDYTSNVPKKEIEKAQRDLEKNQDYHCGILVSLRSGIATKEDLSIEYTENNKPIIYLHKVSENPDVLKLAISLLFCMVRNDLNNECQIDIQKELSNLKTELNNILQNKKEFKKTLNALESVYSNVVKDYEKRIDYFINKFSNNEKCEKNYIDIFFNEVEECEGNILLLEEIFSRINPDMRIKEFGMYLSSKLGDSIYYVKTHDLELRKRYKIMKGLKNNPRDLKEIVVGYRFKEN